jgi:hypothetical protein
MGKKKPFLYFLSIKMSTDLMKRKNYKWFALIALLSMFALLSKYCRPTTGYSYYRRDVFDEEDIVDLETTNTTMISWTDRNSK